MIFTVRGVSDWLKAKPIWLLVLLAVCSCQPTLGQTTEETPQQTNEKIQHLASQVSARSTDSPIGSGDLLHIDVFDIPELSREIRVGDGGSISYPLIPVKIQAAGLTPIELQESLERLLIENGLVSHPQVSVFVKEQNSQPVSVVGAVTHTMVYQVIRPTTLLEVLAAAGGISDDAGSIVMITRPNPPGVPQTKTVSATASTSSSDDQQIITIRLQDLLESGNAVFNVPVYGGDVVSVPRAGIVYVLGFGVAQAGGYVLQSHGEQVTVLKAVALAHGLTSFAKADSAVIMRSNPATGTRDQIPVHIKAIENHKEDDVPMKSNDILYIPDSRGLKVLARTGEAAIGIGSGIAIYRAP